jgi:GntR family transcriptional regulator
VTRESPSPDVAERLRLDPATACVVRRENWYFADGGPVRVAVT